MKISTKSRYGLRAIVDLAVHEGQDHVSLARIAERQAVSVQYLEQVFSLLKKAGLVKSVKGAHGGYVLADKPHKILVHRVLLATGGALSIAQGEKEYEDIRGFLYQSLWSKIDRKINETVKSITLADLVDQYRQKCEDSVDMYHI